MVAHTRIFHKLKEEINGSEVGWHWWPLQQSQVSVHRLANPTVLRVWIQKLPCLQIKVHRAPSSCKINLKFLSYTSWGSSHLPTYQDRLHLSWYIQQKRMGHTFFPTDTAQKVLSFLLSCSCSMKSCGFSDPHTQMLWWLTLLQTFKYGFNTVCQCSIVGS